MNLHNSLNRIVLTATVALVANLAGCGSNPAAPPVEETGAGKAVELNGNISGLNVINSQSTYQFIHQDVLFTLEAWIKLDDPTDRDLNAILGNTSTTREHGFFFVLENRVGQGNNQLRLMVTRGVRSVDAYSDENVITDDDWHHVAVTATTTEIRFFVDGQPAGDTDDYPILVRGLQAASRDLMIGDIYSREAEQWQFDGELDEVRIWEVERSQAEIQVAMRTPLGAKYTDDASLGLAGYWRFDVLEDLRIAREGTNDVRDRSANRRHANLFGGSLVRSEAF